MLNSICQIRENRGVVENDCVFTSGASGFTPLLPNPNGRVNSALVLVLYRGADFCVGGQMIESRFDRGGISVAKSVG